MAFTFTWAARAFSNGPVRQQHFTYTCLATDTSATVTPPSFSDRVDYVIMDGVCRTAADSLSGTTATLAVEIAANATYSFTVSSANATVGSTYAAANGQLFVTTATIAAQTTFVAAADANGTALAATGTLTKISGTGDATITYTATGTPTLYGTGIAFGV